VKQADYTGIGGGNPKCHASRDGKGNDESYQQAAQVRPTFPSIQQKPTDLFPNA
jgi:hypothetical protein